MQYTLSAMLETYNQIYMMHFKTYSFVGYASILYSTYSLPCPKYMTKYMMHIEYWTTVIYTYILYGTYPLTCVRYSYSQYIALFVKYEYAM